MKKLIVILAVVMFIFPVSATTVLTQKIDYCEGGFYYPRPAYALEPKVVTVLNNACGMALGDFTPVITVKGYSKAVYFVENEKGFSYRLHRYISIDGKNWTKRGELNQTNKYASQPNVYEHSLSNPLERLKITSFNEGKCFNIKVYLMP